MVNHSLYLVSNRFSVQVTCFAWLAKLIQCSFKSFPDARLAADVAWEFAEDPNPNSSLSYGVPTAAPDASLADVVWEFEKYSDYWVAMDYQNYPKEFSAKLTMMFFSSELGMKYDYDFGIPSPESPQHPGMLTGTVPYTIDFNNMTQMNGTNTVEKRIRVIFYNPMLRIGGLAAAPDALLHLADVVWEFEKYPNYWVAMDIEFSAALTLMFFSSKAGAHYVHDYGFPSPESRQHPRMLTGIVPYTIDSNKMTQMNDRNEVVKRIRLVFYKPRLWIGIGDSAVM